MGLKAATMLQGSHRLLTGQVGCHADHITLHPKGAVKPMRGQQQREIHVAGDCDRAILCVVFPVRPLRVRADTSS